MNITSGAVSKWERGLSYPDISIIEELAKVLGVSVVELLNGKRQSLDGSMSVDEVEELIDYSIMISELEIARQKERSRMSIIFLVMLVKLLVSIILNIVNYTKLQNNIEAKPKQNIERNYDAFRGEDANVGDEE